VEELGLAETIEALREELETAMARAEGRDVRFLVGAAQVEFNVGVRREGGAGGKARFWVLEAAADARYVRETVQKVTLTLEPVGRDGSPVHVRRGSDERP
jgi:NTP-dependent ternary system trypsin peptidase co-occuring protein